MTILAHAPVMLEEVLAALVPRDGGAYVDGTFGNGGYTRAILEAADTVVWAIDRDPDAIERGHELMKRFPGRLTVLHGRFGDMPKLLRAAGVDRVDGVVLDLGVSSPQLDDATRGFSFRLDGPLDMRMDRTGPSAADLVNGLDENALATILRSLGEERHARRIARAIVAARSKAPIVRTRQLAEVVRAAVPRRGNRIDPATRTFLALRIHVNDELGELDRGLAAAERLLAPGGRLAVVSFHSLEDRRVKTFLRTRSASGSSVSRHLPAEGNKPAPTFRLVTRSATRPSAEEIAANPRARSARLRVAERTEAAPWPEREAA